MKQSISVAALCLAIALAAPGIAPAQHPLPNGLLGTRPVYGYDALESHYGPIEAQRELDCLTYQPGVRGLDHGYGLGYFLGFGPPAQHASHASVPATEARGFIDARWSSGYIRHREGDQECGFFSVRPGCNCLTPPQYRGFAPAVMPIRGEDQPGDSWYAGGPPATAYPSGESMILPPPVLDPE